MNKILLLFVGVGLFAFASKNKSIPILGTDVITDDGEVIRFQTPIAP